MVYLTKYIYAPHQQKRSTNVATYATRLPIIQKAIYLDVVQRQGTLAALDLEVLVLLSWQVH